MINVAEVAAKLTAALIVSGETGHADYIAGRAIAVARALKAQLEGDTVLSTGDAEAAKQGLSTLLNDR